MFRRMRHQRSCKGRDGDLRGPGCHSRDLTRQQRRPSEPLLPLLPWPSPFRYPLGAGCRPRPALRPYTPLRLPRGLAKGRGRRNEEEPTAARRSTEIGAIRADLGTPEVALRTPPRRRDGAEQQTLPPATCVLRLSRSGTRRPSAPRTQGVVRYLGIPPERFLSGIRRRPACVNRESWSSRFTCKSPEKREPTSGLEPLTCSSYE